MHLPRFPLPALGLGLLLFAAAGCEKAPSHQAGPQADPRVDPQTDPGPDATSTPAVLDTLFVSDAPAGAVPLIQARTSAKPGDRVVFEARVGGRRDPFLADRAVFLVADPSLLSCDQIHGDTCKTPWDYCCEERDHLRKHMATIQVVDDGGAPLKVSLQDRHGLKALETVVVTGTVDQADEAGNFVVNAESIHVKEG